MTTNQKRRWPWYWPLNGQPSLLRLFLRNLGRMFAVVAAIALVFALELGFLTLFRPHHVWLGIAIFLLGLIAVLAFGLALWGKHLERERIERSPS